MERRMYIRTTEVRKKKQGYERQKEGVIKDGRKD